MQYMVSFTFVPDTGDLFAGLESDDPRTFVLSKVHDSGRAGFVIHIVGRVTLPL